MRAHHHGIGRHDPGLRRIQLESAGHAFGNDERLRKARHRIIPDEAETGVQFGQRLALDAALGRAEDVHERDEVPRLRGTAVQLHGHALVGALHAQRVGGIAAFPTRRPGIDRDLPVQLAGALRGERLLHGQHAVHLCRAVHGQLVVEGGRTIHAQRTAQGNGACIGHIQGTVQGRWSVDHERARGGDVAMVGVRHEQQRLVAEQAEVPAAQGHLHDQVLRCTVPVDLIEGLRAVGGRLPLTDDHVDHAVAVGRGLLRLLVVDAPEGIVDRETHGELGLRHIGA